jgi:putative membrane protein
MSTASRDQAFLKKAARDNVNEVKMARMAEDRSTNQAVKDFARRLETDHTNCAQQVASLAQSKGITVATIDSLGGTSGSTGTAARSTTDENGTTSSSSTTTKNGSTTTSSSSTTTSNSGYGHMGKLSNATGAQFDREYVKMQVADHEKDIKEFERASNDSHLSSDVRNFAQQTLPTLRDHLQMAKSLQAQVGTSSGSRHTGTSDSSSKSGSDTTPHDQ